MTQTTTRPASGASTWDRFAHRWLSLGGLLTVVGLGNLVAALNWNAIARGSARGGDSLGALSSTIASDRYALYGFAFLVVGGLMVSHRTLRSVPPTDRTPTLDDDRTPAGT